GAAPVKRVDVPLPPPPAGMKLISRLIDEQPPPKEDAPADDEAQGPSELDEMRAAEEATLEPQSASDAALRPTAARAWPLRPRAFRRARWGPALRRLPERLPSAAAARRSDEK